VLTSEMSRADAARTVTRASVSRASFSRASFSRAPSSRASRTIGARSARSGRRWGGWDRWSEQWHVHGHRWRCERHWGRRGRQRWRKRRWRRWHAGEWDRIRWNAGLWYARQGRWSRWHARWGRWYGWYRWHSQRRQRAFAQHWSRRCQMLGRWSERRVNRWHRGQDFTRDFHVFITSFRRGIDEQRIKTEWRTWRDSNPHSPVPKTGAFGDVLGSAPSSSLARRW
jgi:hypothetical protein